MNDTVVYRHIKPCEEVFYVGIGTPDRPYDRHHRNQFWHHVVKKYPDYKVDVVATGLSWEMACELEELMILEYGRRDLGTGTLVNLTNGGDGSKGVVRSEETRQKISAAKKGENAPWYGKKLSKEHRQKISAAKQNISQETRQKMSAAKKGKPSEKRKLTFEQAQEIRHRYKTEKITYHKLALEYGVSNVTISNIIKNKTYTKPE